VIGRLLLIDDDVELTRLLSELLIQESFGVDTNPGTADAASLAASGAYALVILDVMLPGTNGFDVLRQIRTRSRVPVILLSARGQDVDRIVGLELGADDYVPKPFNTRELLARIRAVLRRAEPGASDRERQVVAVDDVTLDSASRMILRGGRPVDLTSVEFDMLRVLLESAGRTVSRDTLATTVLGHRLDAYDRSVDMHVSRLRRKLAERGPGEERIKTVRGIGYIYTLPMRG
jgi:two-component system response regulator CpxR